MNVGSGEDQAFVTAIFVYGTLKKDQLRGRMWPRTPANVSAATVAAELYDLGSYPGMCALEPEEAIPLVLGEIWEFLPEDVEETLRVLDRIEGYRVGDRSCEYTREKVWATPVIDSECFSDTAPMADRCCWTYFLSDRSRVLNLRKIEPTIAVGVLGMAARWPDGRSRVPKSVEEE